MYSNAALYYLNQMGIRPWVKRTQPLSLLEKSNAGVKLLIFISANLSNKAQSLLRQMLTYINLSEQELTIIPIQKNDSLTLPTTKGYKPLAILLLGFHEKQLGNDVNFACPILTSNDPDYLIANPSEKRKAFQDLNHINQLIS